MSLADPTFEEHRADLERLAYRMLGSRADADDVLQEAYLRWSRVERANVDSPRAYLSSIVTRLSIDRRRMVDARKETYVGPWLPEPIVEPRPEGLATPIETAESVSLALLVVLETLSPPERAAYLLRRLFDFDYAQIGNILEQSDVNCRQLVSRAEKRIAERRPRFEPSVEEAERITAAFLESCRTGDLEGLTQLLAADAVAESDGGGKVTAARVPIVGADKVARFFIGILRKQPADIELRPVRVNGRPGVLSVIAGKVDNVFTFDIADGRIRSCFIIRNPDKLTHLASLENLL